MKSKNSHTTQKIVQGFLKYLEDNDQLNHLAELTKLQQRQSWAREKQDEAQVTSCIPLTTAEKKIINDFLQKNFAATAKVKISYLVDQDILGGLVIKVGNKIIDASLKHRLEKLGEELTYA